MTIREKHYTNEFIGYLLKHCFCWCMYIVNGNVILVIIINIWFSAPPIDRTMTHYTVQFYSAIPELVTVSSPEQERFQETLEDWRGTHQLEFCWQPVPCSRGWQQKTPSRRISDGSRERISCHLARREDSIVVGHQWLQSACQSSTMALGEQSLCAQRGTIYSRPVAWSATSATPWVLTSRGRADADDFLNSISHWE